MSCLLQEYADKRIGDHLGRRPLVPSSANGVSGKRSSIRYRAEVLTFSEHAACITPSLSTCVECPGHLDLINSLNILMLFITKKKVLLKYFKN